MLMRLLMLTQVLPYPIDAGPKVRAYYVLRHLAERGHEVTLVSFVRDDDSEDHIEHLRSFCRAVHTVPMRRSRIKDVRYLTRSLLTGESFIIARDTDQGMHRLVARLLAEEQVDIIHADQLWMAQYAIWGDGVKRVLDAHNAVCLIPQRLAEQESNPLKRWVLERERRALARYEGDICRRFDHVVAVTEEDREILAGLHSPQSTKRSGKGRGSCAPTSSSSLSALRDLRGETVTVGNHFTVIPICVDPAEKQPVRPSPIARRVLILGTMFYPPNVEGALWFAREVFPLVLRDVVDAKLTIIGKNPPPSVRHLGESLGSNVEITGYVEDPTPYLEETAAFLVPLHAGGGMRVKILDAWCWGIPIVSTTVGAEGIDVYDGENILIGDDAAAFARAVVRVMKDPDLAQRLRDHGREWVGERYNWRTVYHKWDEVYTRLTEKT